MDNGDASRERALRAMASLASSTLAERSRGIVEMIRWQTDSPGVSLIRVVGGDVHTPLINSGYASAVMSYLQSSTFVRDCEGFAHVRRVPYVAHDWDTIPNFRSTASARTVFEPAGFHNGVSMLLPGSSGMTVGVVHLAATSEHIDSATHRLLQAMATPLSSWLQVLGRMEDAKLTHRELEICMHIRDGYSNAQIAALLHVSVRTVATHVENILRKIKADNRTQIAVETERWGVAN